MSQEGALDAPQSERWDADAQSQAQDDLNLVYARGSEVVKLGVMNNRVRETRIESFSETSCWPSATRGLGQGAGDDVGVLRGCAR